MKVWLAVCLSCGLEAPPELLERNAEGWLLCPACGTDNVAEFLDFEDDDGSVAL